MNLDNLIALAKEQGASDLHIEAGLPPALRIRGVLRVLSEPVSSKLSLEMVRETVGEAGWDRFLARGSFDLSKTIHGVRCRINALQTARGVGMAIRLLATFQATLEKLNLHPDLRKLVVPTNGLVILSGATGSGKSSTMAALVQEINLSESRHIVTIESPIEYAFQPRRAFIRQREVGRDTPSFEQAIIDSLREDPDVLMVGEMRESEVMRLTLNASETGHLVLATIHSATCVEALQRLIAAFPSEIQDNVRAQLADCLVGVVSQRLRYRADLKIRVPECEILIPSTAVKSHIRSGNVFKAISCIETGAEYGMWTFQRYQSWLEKKKSWYLPGDVETPDSEPVESLEPGSLPTRITAAPGASSPDVKNEKTTPLLSSAPRAPGGPIEIEPVEGGLDQLLKNLKHEAG
jgi:twitching motility protein PilT